MYIYILYRHKKKYMRKPKNIWRMRGCCSAAPNFYFTHTFFFRPIRNICPNSINWQANILILYNILLAIYSTLHLGLGQWKLAMKIYRLVSYSLACGPNYNLIDWAQIEYAVRCDAADIWSKVGQAIKLIAEIHQVFVVGARVFYVDGALCLQAITVQITTWPYHNQSVLFIHILNTKKNQPKKKEKWKKKEIQFFGT